MQTNRKVTGFAPRTHEGAVVNRTTAEQDLIRSVLSCMLFENTFYESGESIAERITSLVKNVEPYFAANLAVTARTDYNLRHAPLWLIASLLKDKKNNSLIRDLVYNVIQRPDELGEILAMFLGDAASDSHNNKPIPRQLRLGIADAFTKFDAYRLGKYNRKDRAVTLRDAMFISRPKPKDEEQAAVFKRLADDILESPDTWEVALSGGANKRETFERLMAENKLGAMAAIRNLRNMTESGISTGKIKEYLLSMNVSRVLPFRFYVAAKIEPVFETELETLMLRALESQPKLKGKTRLLVDTSGSMQTTISGRSVVTAQEAGAVLGSMIRELGEEVRAFSFASTTIEVPARRGFAFVDSFRTGQVGHGTDFQQAYNFAKNAAPGFDRTIFVSDMQSWSRVPAPDGIGYMMNVASYENAIGYGPSWTNIDGFSASALKWMVEYERGLS